MNKFERVFVNFIYLASGVASGAAIVGLIMLVW